MKAVFVDTGGWMACADGADPAHVRCCAARDGALEGGYTLITTDFVVDETLALIRFRLGLSAADAWWQQVDGSAPVRWERVESDRFETARQLFFRYRDKDLSYTDCTSIAVMRELKLTTVITTDRHFQQVERPVWLSPCTVSPAEEEDDGPHHRTLVGSRSVPADPRAVPRARGAPRQGAWTHMVHVVQAARPQRYRT